MEQDATPPSESFELVYECNLETLSPELRRAWIPLTRDLETERFIERAQAHRASALQYRLAQLLGVVLSDFDVNGLLGLYPMLLLTTLHWKKLLGSQPRSTLLDVGAGNGDVTDRLAPLFSNVHTTEHSRMMVRRLRRKGYTCVRVPLADPLPSDAVALPAVCEVVTCLNVLDRTSHPRRVLSAAAQRVAAGGLLVVAVPLPLGPFYYDGARTLDPIQRFSLSGSDWLSQTPQLVRWLSEQLEHFELAALTRCPYLSGGDPQRPLYVLDDAVVVFRRRQ